jgi:hypothetical protein
MMILIKFVLINQFLIKHKRVKLARLPGIHKVTFLDINIHLLYFIANLNAKAYPQLYRTSQKIINVYLFQKKTRLGFNGINYQT